MKYKDGQLDYIAYLKLDQLTSLQQPLSANTATPAHDEMMYIITHQCFELWFKLIIHELNSVISILGANYVDERHVATSLSRLKRVREIQDLIQQQFKVLSTLTPLDYLDWRGLLTSASGFQSFQFRMIENLIGLDPSKRIHYGDLRYYDTFNSEKKQLLLNAEKSPSLFTVLDAWLARTPFLDSKQFNFLEKYERAVSKMLGSDGALASSYVVKDKSEVVRSNASQTFSAFFSEAEYEKLRENGEKRLSWRSALAVLFISLYRDEPILQLPYRLLETVIDMDEKMAIWRYTHTLVVHKMIGKRPGTAGSAGFDYLRATVEQHRVFSELFDMGTLLIPRSELPELPEPIKQQLGFFYGARPE